MRTIHLVIDSCVKCHYSKCDSNGTKLECRKSHGKMIYWLDEEVDEIPEWCPLYIKYGV